jgi:hypothetical protein
MVVTMKNAVFFDVTPCGFCISSLRLLVTAKVPTSLILVTLMMEAIIPLKRRFLQEAHGVTIQKSAFFIKHVSLTGIQCRVF